MAKLFVAISALLAVAAASSIGPFGKWKIVGGDDASEGQFPYIVSLRQSGRHFCGGSILNENWILTAAHCVDGSSAGSFTVQTGAYLLNSGGKSYNVKKIVQHENYDSYNIMNDVALVQVASPIEFDANTQPIERETNDVGGGADAILCGWGTTTYPGSAPNNLQFINLKTITVAECKDAQSPNPVYDSQVCTFTRSNEGACHGDSGGPLTSGGKQIGIVSWGIPCGAGYPDVFTRVSSFDSWITSNMN